VAQNKVFKTDSITNYQIARFICDKTRTTVPFHTIKPSAEDIVVQAAKKRAARQLKAFHNVFDQADSLSVSIVEERS
jgi:hypothetical protein